MQTREPRKRVNWVFVITLIIAVPLIIFVLLMMNILPPVSSDPDLKEDSIKINQVDTIKADTTRSGF